MLSLLAILLSISIGVEYIIGLFSIRAGLSNEKSFQNKINVIAF